MNKKLLALCLAAIVPLAACEDDDGDIDVDNGEIDVTVPDVDVTTPDIDVTVEDDEGDETAPATTSAP